MLPSWFLINTLKSGTLGKFLRGNYNIIVVVCCVGMILSYIQYTYVKAATMSFYSQSSQFNKIAKRVKTPEQEANLSSVWPLLYLPA